MTKLSLPGAREAHHAALEATSDRRPVHGHREMAGTSGVPANDRFDRRPTPGSPPHGSRPETSSVVQTVPGARPACSGFTALLGADEGARAALEPIRSGFSPGYFYAGTRRNDFDCYTNEIGLDSALRRLEIRGGAAVGVSGAILDVGSAIRADAIISLDANPVIADAISVMAGVLLLVDRERTQPSWPAQARAERVAEVLHALSSETRPPELVPRLQHLGVPRRALDPEVFVALNPKLSRHSNWLTGFQAAERVEHLTGLARRGHIRCVTTDLSNESTPARVNALLQELGLRTSAFHLSNVPDYVENLEGLFAALGQLDARPDAQLISSAVNLHTSLPEAPEVARLGSFQRPAIRPLDTWTRKDGYGAQLARACRASEKRSQFLSLTDGRPGVLRQCGSLDAVLQDPAKARLLVQQLLSADGSIVSAQGESVERLPAPGSAEEIPAALEAAERSYFTPERARAVLEAGLRHRHFDPDWVPDLDVRAARVSSSAEARLETSEMCAALAASFPSWPHARKQAFLARLLEPSPYSDAPPPVWKRDPEALLAEAETPRALEHALLRNRAPRDPGAR